MKRIYFILLLLVMFFSCSQGKKIEVDLNKDFIKLLEPKQWNSEYFFPVIDYFTNNGFLIISSYAGFDNFPNYIIQVTNEKLILIPFKFRKPELKLKSRLEFFINEKDIHKIYGDDNIISPYVKNGYIEYPDENHCEYLDKMIRISDDRIVAILINSSFDKEIGPPDEFGNKKYLGYLGFYDGKELKRVYLSLYNEVISFNEITSWLYYDKVDDSLYLVGGYTNYSKMGKNFRLFKYSLRDGKLKEFHSSKKRINSMFRIPGTDYLMFWDDGVVLKRIVE